MRLTFCLAIFLFGLFQNYYSQSIQVINNDNNLTKEFYTIEGTYEFNYNGIIHLVKLSSKDGVFEELDLSGLKLSSGKFIRNSNNFALKPLNISSSSVLSENIQFEILNKIDENLNIIVFIDDSHSVEILLLKK